MCIYETEKYDESRKFKIWNINTKHKNKFKFIKEYAF